NGSVAKSSAAFDLEAATVAPELAYVTARYTALAPFGKVASLLSELLPISGAQNAGTVRNRTLRVGEDIVPHPAKTAQLTDGMPRCVSSTRSRRPAALEQAST